MMDVGTNMPQSSSGYRLEAKASRCSCKGLCSFMSGFTDAFQSSLATPCKIFLAENPSGDKVEVTGSGSGSELHIVPVSREAVLPRDVPTVAARGHQPAVTVHFWISGFGPQGHFRSLDFGIFGFRDFRILGFSFFVFLIFQTNFLASQTNFLAARSNFCSGPI